MSTFNKINELLKNYELFLKENSNGDFSDFGQWLSCRYAEAEEIEQGNLTQETKNHQEFYKEMPIERQFLTLLSRTSRFVDFYIRKALEEININSRLEFQFLISIKEMGEPPKTDVIYFNLTEISTGVQTLKRLQNRGLIKDYADKTDKRVRRLRITPKGEEVLKDALKRFDVLDKLTYSFGLEKDWKSFIPALLSFNEVHNKFYQANRQKNFSELSHKIKNGDYEN